MRTINSEGGERSGMLESEVQRQVDILGGGGELKHPNH